MRGINSHHLLGSEYESRLVVMQYNGARKADTAPVAFVGKGVTFDTGGISIKPSNNMHEMKTDMGGAAAVVGVMRALAARKAHVNAVGVVGLVENMPDGRGMSCISRYSNWEQHNGLEMLCIHLVDKLSKC